MLLSHHYKIPALISLVFILGILSVGAVASIVGSRKDTAKIEPPPLLEDGGSS